MPDNAPDVLTLRDYVAVLQRQRWFILAVFVAVLAVAALVTAVQPPTYAAQVRITVEPPSDRDELERILFGTTEAATQAEIVASGPVVQQALEAVGEPADPQSVEEFIDGSVEVEALMDTTVIEVTVEAGDPQRAADLAQAIAQAFLERVEEQTAERVEQVLGELEAEVGATRAEVRSVEAQLAAGAQSTRASLEQERDDLQAKLRSLATRRAELETVAPIARRAQIVQPAVPPTDATSPKPLLNAILALVLGTGLAVALGFVRDWRGGRIRDDSFVRDSGAGPVLAVVPEVDREPVLVEQVDGLASSEYRRLRAQLLASHGASSDRGTVLAVVPVGETGDAGAAAANLALALVGIGRRVALVHADVHPVVNGFRLTGEANRDGWAVVHGVQLLSADHLRRLGPDGFGSPAARQLVADAVARADDLVIAAPPLERGDALDVVARADEVLLVVHPEVSSRGDIRAAVQTLERMGARVVGSVLVPLRDSPSGSPGAQDRPPVARASVGSSS
jgi:capsular polysaccharide biosynthesis protein